MARALPTSLAEISRFGGTLIVTCRACGRKARFDPGNLSRWLRVSGKSDDWRSIRRKFVCKGMDAKGCGSRDVDVSFELTAPDPPKGPPVALDGCPLGVDPVEWAKADHYGRKRLVRIARD